MDFEESESISGGVLCILVKSNICPHMLDVQEANVSSSQIGNYFFGCSFADGWNSRSRSIGMR